MKKEIDLANELFGKKPSSALKMQILDVLDNLAKEENIDLQNPPLINAYSELENWRKAVGAIQAPLDLEENYLYPLQTTDKIHQFLAWTKNGVPDEMHDEMQESFLILEGTCHCQIGEEFYDYKAGDFFEIPLNTFHNLQVTSQEPVKVILQRIFI